MRELFLDYWDKIAKNPMYWIPLTIFSFAGYGFSICNRTIHGDDMMKDCYHDILPFSDRWGMLVWSKLIGITDFVPFIDRFVTLLFLLIASVLISFLFYFYSKQKDSIISFTVLSSMVLTYPLINEIFEYTEADVQYAGNLALMIFAFIYLALKLQKPTIRVILTASIIMILPASSYEVGIFSYITLLCAVVLYKHINNMDVCLTTKKWLWENIYFLSPLILAIVYRFVVHYFVLSICDASYIQMGGIQLDNDHSDLTYIIGSNVFKYFAAALVYFPISVFVILSFCFLLIILKKVLENGDIKIILYAIVLYLSVFLLPIVQGLCMPYRTAQTLTIFVAFVSFLLCEIRNPKFHFVVSSSFIFLCWHQAVYLNNVLSLNNMRSNNEIESLRYVGYRIMSEFGSTKPVVFIAELDAYGGNLSPWIEKRVYADTDTWNGRIFDRLVKDYLPEKFRRYKYINSNVNNVLNWTPYSRLEDFFSYCGFNINLVSFSSLLAMEKNPILKKQLEEQYEKAITSMGPLEIKDIGKCILVKY